jgi:hypothetical protein
MTMQEGGPALFFDIHALYDSEYADLRDVIERFGAEEGLTQTKQLWRTWYYDSELYDAETDTDGAWRFMVVDTREEAIEYANDANEESDDDPETRPAAKGHFEVEPVTIAVGTEKLESLVGCRLDRSECLDMVAIVWLEQVVLPAFEEGRGINTATPALVGVWWNETYDPASLSAPRGGIFPASLTNKFSTEVVADVEDEPHIGECSEIRLSGFRSPAPR